MFWFDPQTIQELATVHGCNCLGVTQFKYSLHRKAVKHGELSAERRASVAFCHSVALSSAAAHILFPLLLHARSRRQRQDSGPMRNSFGRTHAAVHAHERADARLATHDRAHGAPVAHHTRTIRRCCTCTCTCTCTDATGRSLDGERGPAEARARQTLSAGFVVEKQIGLSLRALVGWCWLAN